MPLPQRLSEASGNHGRELSYRYEKFVRSIVPGGSVIGHSAAGNQHMHMGMMMESACPCVQDRKDAHLRTDVAFLGGKIAYCIGSNLHQQAIKYFLMPQKQAAQLTGHSSDNVEIVAGQYLGGSALQPIRNLPSVAFGA